MNTSVLFQILFSTLRGALMGERVEPEALKELTEQEWKRLFRMAAQQGVLAIVYDVISGLPEECQPPRAVRIQWALSVEAIENRYELQRKTSALLADLWAEKGIQTIVMKGLAVGTYYPVPAHREFGDLDCFLGEHYELGNQLCEQIGAKVSRDYYKDSTIKYRGLMVENHRFFLPVRGSRKMKTLERHLRKIALDGRIDYVPDTKLIVPTADFNALFLTMHGLNHFLTEGIKLRHILDWALLLKAEQESINWQEFYHWADKMHLTRFADALTAISVEHFGLQITNPAIYTTSPYAERVLEDVLYKSEGVYNKNYSAWKSRFVQVGNKLSSVWKYHKIYQKSVFVELTKSLFAFLFEKNPKL